MCGYTKTRNKKSVHFCRPVRLWFFDKGNNLSITISVILRFQLFWYARPFLLPHFISFRD